MAAQASTAAQGITAPLKASQASWHPQGLLSGPASTVRHWSFTLRPRTLARGLKGFCGFCAGSAGPRHSPPYSSPERPHWNSLETGEAPPSAGKRSHPQPAHW